MGASISTAQNINFYDGKVIGIHAPKAQDYRGILTTIEFGSYGFCPVRAFLVSANPGAVRGGHAHLRGRQILMHVSGEIEIEVRYMNELSTFMLNQKCPAVLIEPAVWSRQRYLGSDPAMIVFCDTPYDPKDYVREEIC